MYSMFSAWGGTGGRIASVEDRGGLETVGQCPVLLAIVLTLFIPVVAFLTTFFLAYSDVYFKWSLYASLIGQSFSYASSILNSLAVCRAI